MIRVEKFHKWCLLNASQADAATPREVCGLEEFTRDRATSAACRFGPFAKPYRNHRDLRIPAIKAAASSGHRRKRAIEF
jgi:hypothetical protein